MRPGDGDASDGDTLAAPESDRTPTPPAAAWPAGARELPVVDRSRYVHAGELGRGGLGRVMRASDRWLGRTVALKELLVQGDSQQDRFTREALLTARLEHPAIVPLYDAGRWPEGEPFYAMRLVSGEPLEKLIAGAAALEDRLGLVPHVLAVAGAVAYAHSKRVVHRDLKPANVIVGAFGETVVIDWGAAKVLEGGSVSSHEEAAATHVPRGGTVVGAIIGTPAYMPPEQAQGLPVAEPADVYALGAMLYHVLAGEPPYGHCPALETVRRVLKEPPPPLAERCPEVPRDLLAIVNKAMAREPGDRYPTARELAEDLGRYHHGKLVSVHPYSVRELVARWVRRYRLPLAMAAVFVVLGAIGAALSLRRIVEERREAQAQRAAAVAAQGRAEQQSQGLLLAQARNLVDRDPTAALAWLKLYPPEAGAWEQVRAIATDAWSRGAARHVLRGHDGPVWGVAFSPDGRGLASVGVDGTLRLWDLERGRARALRGHAGEVNTVAYLPGGRELLTGSDDRTVRRWDAASGSSAIVARHDSSVISVAASRAGNLRASGSYDGTILLWSEGGEPQRLGGHVGEVWGLAFSPDGRQLASAGADHTVRLFDPASGAGHVLGRHAAAVTAIAFSPDGRTLATASEDTQLRLWDVATGESRALEGHTADVWGVAFAPDGALLASGASDGTVRLWDVATAESRSFVGHASAVSRVAFSPAGGLVASASDDGTVRVWGIVRPQGLVLRGHSGEVARASFSPDGHLLGSVSVDGTARIWSAASGAAERVLPGLTRSWPRLRFPPRAAEVACVAEDGSVVVWDLARGQPGPVVPAAGQVRDLAYSADGDRLVIGGTGRAVRVWDRATGRVRALEGPGQLVSKVAFARGGRAVVATSGPEVWVWDLGTGRARTLRGHEGWIQDLAISPDGERAATVANDRTVRLWDLTSGESRALLGHESVVTVVVFSADGSRLATAGRDMAVRLWDVTTGDSRALIGHTGLVLALAFSPDGRLLASGALDQTVRVWDVASGDASVLQGHQGGVTDVAFSPTADTLATGSLDGTVRLWPVTALGRLPAGRAELRAFLERATTARVSQGGTLATPGW